MRWSYVLEYLVIAIFCYHSICGTPLEASGTLEMRELTPTFKTNFKKKSTIFWEGGGRVIFSRGDYWYPPLEIVMDLPRTHEKLHCTVKENLIGSVVSKILWYTHTHRDTHPLTFISGFTLLVNQTSILYSAARWRQCTKHTRSWTRSCCLRTKLLRIRFR